MDADLVLNTVEKFFKTLAACPAPLVDASRLPASKEAIKNSIKTLWFTLDDESMKPTLKEAYISLARFQTDVPDLVELSGKDSPKDDALLESYLKRLSKDFPRAFSRLSEVFYEELESLRNEVELWEKDEF